MTETSTARPDHGTPPSGMVYVPVPDPQYRPARDGSTCRFTEPYIQACGEPAVVEKEHPNDPIGKWWGYCTDPKHSKGRWVQDGTVVKWELRREGREDVPLTAREASRADSRLASTAAGKPGDWCSQHRCRETECADRSHVVSFRAPPGLIPQVEARMAELGISRNDALTQAVEEWLRDGGDGSVRAPSSVSRTPSVPPGSVKFSGDTGAGPAVVPVPDRAGKRGSRS